MALTTTEIHVNALNKLCHLVVDHFVDDGSLAKSEEICDTDDSVIDDHVACSMDVLRCVYLKL